MAEVKSDDICLDNKESAAASSSSVSENSSSILLKSPGISSPSTSPAHRYSSVIYSVYIYIYYTWILCIFWDEYMFRISSPNAIQLLSMDYGLIFFGSCFECLVMYDYTIP